jgi:hypothetical protein
MNSPKLNAPINLITKLTNQQSNLVTPLTNNLINLISQF